MSELGSESSGQSELTVDELTVRFGAHTAVDGVSLTVSAGSVLGLAGESGSGKSTIARAIVGMAPISSGSIRYDGAQLRTPDRRIQLVFQDPAAALDPRRSIGSSIAEGLRAKRTARRARVRELLELVHIDPARANLMPRAFSGGQLQRVCIARALAAEPAFLIADEITSALDVSVQGAVLNVLREIQRETGIGILFISHNLAVLRYLADSMAVLRAGKLVEQGETENLLGAPEHEYTKQLIDAVPGQE
ncbi:ABC transporter ATP-binding protein [Sciscionella sediminilitoris]|uniref:ABC transporter ATP-binding protein n=1 Tax=Sciscionella sediminilitoris TaxID=1445613 RepID=UPI0004DF0656|nr:ABC transporter ATP-binding protein [Sciscionella sp. SE31]